MEFTSIQSLVQHSPTSLIFNLTCVAALLSLAKYVYQGLKNPLYKVPGPFFSRFTNLPLKLAVISGRRIHHVHTLHERYGPLVLIAPREVAVADVKAYKQIHGVASGFQKSEWYRDMVVAERDGVFAMTDGKTHAARRRLLSRPFSKSHLRQHWENVISEKVQLAVSRIRKEGVTGSADVLKWFTFMASDVSTHLMFGEDFRTLERGEVSDYIRTLQKALMGSGIGVELPLVRWVGSRLPLQSCREMFAVNETLLSYGNVAVANMKTAQAHTNIFANMMAEAEKGERLDDEDVRMEAQNLIVAGTDTTSITLTYLIWAVLLRPELQHRVEAEIKTLPENFCDSDVEQLQLLTAVIEETLRLYGAAPGGLPRIVPIGGTVMNDVFLPGGTTVTTQAYTYHRDPKLFQDPLR
ncbi:hypothetical protein LTR37_021332 [Vermiconidia calcicola]|uniref:Uncharacterized protein n=1 Tax=Vermiconidia calcicola TaxID=1690605 RepID=A0ACC3MA09_9PEZI|nr:hypothetical protein LTR37_021332 [Vermiconidia calcicola]